MKQTLRILVIVVSVAIGLAQTTQSQTVNVRFNTRINVGAGSGGVDQLQVGIEAATTADFELGTSAFRFFYNSSALELPSQPTGGNTLLVDGSDYEFLAPWVGSTPPFYTENSATTSGTVDRLSVNLGLGLVNAGETLASASGFVPIANVYFDISNATSTEGLQWVANRIPTDPNPSIILKEDDVTPVTLGSLADSDKSLDPPQAVDLAEFDGVCDGSDVLLSWATLSETQNSGFFVELAAADSVWQRVDFVQGSGTSNQRRAYEHRVTNLDPGSYRFRLQQVDVDGTSEFLPEISLIVEVVGDFLIGNPYPNPFSDQVAFTLAVREQQVVVVEVFDLLGRQVAVALNAELPANQTVTVRIDGRDFASGMYIVRTGGERFVATANVLHVN